MHKAQQWLQRQYMNNQTSQYGSYMSVFENHSLQSARPTLRYISSEFGCRSPLRRLIRVNLPQIVTHILQKAFFKHALISLYEPSYFSGNQKDTSFPDMPFPYKNYSPNSSEMSDWFHSLLSVDRSFNFNRTIVNFAVASSIAFFPSSDTYSLKRSFSTILLHRLSVRNIILTIWKCAIL